MHVGSIRELEINSADGVSSCLRVIGDAARVSAVIVCFPAMGVPASKYDRFALALHESGVAVVVAELRGIGSSSMRASRTMDFGYHDAVHYDVPAAVNKARELFPDLPLYLAGHSLGGQFAALYLSQQPQAASGLILSASCTVYCRGWSFPGNLIILLLTQLSALLATIVGYFPGDKLGFGGRETRSVIYDWASNARNGKYKLRDTDIDYEAELRKVQIPILTINFADDRMATVQATENLVKKLNNEQVARIVLNARQLETPMADHFAWLKKPLEVATQIERWIDLRANAIQ